MPDVSPTYYRIADGNIALLHTKCTRGICSDSLFRRVAHGLDRFYPLEKLDWMRGFLTDPNQHIAVGCLDCLCAHGLKVSEIRDIAASRIQDRLFSLKVIDLAEKQNDPDTLLLFMEERDHYVNRVIIALKKTGNESYMTTLMMSDNEDLVRTVDKMTR